MALGRIKKRAVRRVVALLGAYARKQGWWDSANFRIYFRIEEKRGSLHFILVSDGFEGRDEFENYKSSINYLRNRLADDPDLFGSIHLVVMTFKQVSEGGLYAIGDDYVLARPRDLWLSTLNEVWPLIDSFAESHNWNKNNYRLLYKEETASDKAAILLVWIRQNLSVLEFRDELKSFLEARLSDQPDILSTLEFKVIEVAAENFESFDTWIALSYPGYRSHILA